MNIEKLMEMLSAMEINQATLYYRAGFWIPFEQKIYLPFASKHDSGLEYEKGHRLGRSITCQYGRDAFGKSRHSKSQDDVFVYPLITCNFPGTSTIFEIWWTVFIWLGCTQPSRCLSTCDSSVRDTSSCMLKVSTVALSFLTYPRGALTSCLEIKYYNKNYVTYSFTVGIFSDPH